MNRRTPQQLLAAKQAELDKLQARANVSASSSLPLYSVIHVALNTCRKNAIEANKVLGKGKTSAKARIAKHQVWIDKINQELETAAQTLAVAQILKGRLSVLLEGFLQQETPPTAKQVTDAVAKLINPKPQKEAESESENA